MRLLTGAFLAALSLSPAHAEARFGTAQCAPGVVIVRTDAGPLDLTVEIADTPKSREQGLMFRRSLDDRSGMLFIYDEPERVSFWMRNTLIPLDIIFIDETGTIRRIHEMAKPLDETPLPGAYENDPDPERLMIVEIAGGEAERLGVEEGQAIAHPRLDPDVAVWPCVVPRG